MQYVNNKGLVYGAETHDNAIPVDMYFVSQAALAIKRAGGGL